MIRFGSLAKAVMPGGGPGGIIMTVLLGIAGAFVGGFLDLGTIVVAIGGAIVLLLGYRLVTTATHAHAHA